MDVRARLMAALKTLDLIPSSCISNSEAYNCVFLKYAKHKIINDPRIFKEYGSQQLLPHSAAYNALQTLCKDYPHVFDPSIREYFCQEDEYTAKETRMRAGRELIAIIAEIDAGKQRSRKLPALDRRGRPVLKTTEIGLHFEGTAYSARPEARTLETTFQIGTEYCTRDLGVGLLVAEDVSWEQVRIYAREELLRRHFVGLVPHWLAWKHPVLGRMTILDEGEFWRALERQWEMSQVREEDPFVFEFWVEVL